jgi:hypothetical protein
MPPLLALDVGPKRPFPDFLASGIANGKLIQSDETLPRIFLIPERPAFSFRRRSTAPLDGLVFLRGFGGGSAALAISSIANAFGKAGRRGGVEAELDRRCHLVDVLPAGPRGADEVFLQLILVDRSTRPDPDCLLHLVPLFPVPGEPELT